MSFVTSDGIYVWTTTFSGDLSLDDISNSDIGEAVTVLDILQTSWIGVSNKTELISNYANVSPNDSEKIDTTWFNFGYVTKNIQNIFVGEDEASVTKNYFDMLYTGNGLKDINNVRGENPPLLQTVTEAGGFYDMPYSIKHGGLLDMLVVENCRENLPTRETLPTYRYYIFTRDINLIKYQKGTYWSENWDKINAVFYGHLDGDNHTVSNMFSTYGLIRAIPNTENLQDDELIGAKPTVEVKNIIFNGGNYSKTGLIAGYVAGGIISNITVTDYGTNSANYVYNGNILNFLSEEDQLLFGDDQKFDILEDVITSINMKLLSSNEKPVSTSDYIPSSDLYSGKTKKTSFAGGLVGVMNGGLITNVSVGGLAVMVYNEVSESDDTKIDLSKPLNEISYTGGIVGIMNGGTITGSAMDGIESSDIIGEVNITKMTVATSFKDSQRVQTFSYVGGVAGYVGGQQTRINDIVLGSGPESEISIYSLYVAGGIAGMLNGATITNCTYSIFSGGGTSTGIRIGYVNWEETEAESGSRVQIVATNLSESLVDETNKKAEYTLGPGDKSKSIYATEMYLGGIVGTMSSGRIESSNFGGGEYTAAVYIYPHNLAGLYSIYLGGIVGDIYAKGEAIVYDCHMTGNIYLKTSQEGVAGGIIGRMRGGTVVKCSTNGDSQVTSLIADPTVYAYEVFDTAGLEKEFIELGDYVIDLFKSGQLWSGLISPKFKEFIGGWNGSGQYDGVNMDHYYEYTQYFGVQTDGYSVAGGIVGRMIYGTLDGSLENLSDSGNVEGEEIYIYNEAKINSNYMAGGIVGEILGQGTSSSITHITNVENRGIVSALASLKVNIDGNLRVVGDTDFDTIKHIVYF